MVSVIIASANKDLLQAVKNNINQTIGVPYEILAFDNREAKKGICEIYNQGIDQAQFDLLCFIHEDVIIQTANWGTIVTSIFNTNERIAVIGIAGSTYKSLTPSGWLSYSGVNTVYSNLLQSFKYRTHETIHEYSNPDDQKLARVVSVDGAWLCVRKEIASKVRFDEAAFTKFHCYDVDFCLSVGLQYEIAVTFDILLHHYSEGNFNREWLEEVFKLHRKWNHLLPIYSKPFTSAQIFQIERQTFKYFIKQLIALGLSANIACQTVWQGNHFRRLSLKLFAKLNYYLIKYFVLRKRRQ